MSTEEKIIDALRAAPPHIAANATVVDHDMVTVLRKGTSEWTCMPTSPDAPWPAPVCGDPTTMQWFKQWMAGEAPTIDRIGISYMLLGEAGADFDHPEATIPPVGKDWYRVGPHLMMVFPASAGDLTKGIGNDTATGVPYVRPFKGARPLLVMPVALPGQNITWLSESAADQERRQAGDRYRCTHCGTTLVYETSCLCRPSCQHAEICCGTTMTKANP
ncbi:hypothetical protein L843_2736 [Mycobacterium intracellulare MIN_061107_1834]|nr:hypothetical protein L843_2736 [Mycobacterium intracellulare MIN_061107_1834]